MRTELMDRLGLAVPIVGAPMGGGPSTSGLVVAVCDAGGLGSIAAGYLHGDAITAEVAKVRTATDRPFAINLFAPSLPQRQVDTTDVTRLLGALREQVGLPPTVEPATVPNFEDQVAAVLEARPAVVSFTFGLLDADVVAALHDVGCFLIGTATTVREAEALAATGTDAVCAQGAEAGAHRGTFLGDASAALVGTFALVPQVCDAVPLPVIAAGGVADGRGVAAALALGAQAVQTGTALLLCPEAGTTTSHREAIASVSAEETCVTDRVTGRHARAVRTALIDSLAEVDVPDYPTMHLLTAELRRTAATMSRTELTAPWCGQAAALATARPAAEIVSSATADAIEIVRRLAGHNPHL